MTTLDEARAALQRHARGPAFVAALEAFEAAVRANERGGTTQAADLRDRIADTLALRENPPGPDGRAWYRDEHYRESFLETADAVLAVLPPPADRAAVLREAADAVFALEYDVMVGEEGDENMGSMREAWDVGTIHASQLLRRLADETPQQEHGRSDVGTEFVRQADQPDETGLAAFEADLGCQTGPKAAPKDGAAAEPEPPVHGESVAHLAGLHDGRDQWAEFAGGSYLTAEHETLGMIAARLGGDRLAWEMANPWVTDTTMPLPAGLRVAIPAQPAVDARQDGARPS